jgi:hypothetical protein
MAACRIRHTEPIPEDKVKKHRSKSCDIILPSRLWFVGRSCLNSSTFIATDLWKINWRCCLKKWRDVLFSWRDWRKSTKEGNHYSWCSIQNTKVTPWIKVSELHQLARWYHSDCFTRLDSVADIDHFMEYKDKCGLLSALQEKQKLRQINRQTMAFHAPERKLRLTGMRRHPPY